LIKGVFFDLYGTLLIYADMPAAWADWLAEFYETLRAHGLVWSREEFSKRCDTFFDVETPPPIDSGLTVYERKIQRLCLQAGLDLRHDALQEIAARTVDVWQRHIPLDPDVPPTLKELKTRGKILALITNYDHPPHIHALLVKLGLATYFEVVVISGSVGIKKPDPRIFQLALTQTVLSPGEVLYVGDAEEDVAGAIAAGIHPIFLRRKGPGEANPSPPTGSTVITQLTDLLGCLK